MTNTLPAIRQPNYQFSYVHPGNNFPLTGVQKVEEELLKISLSEPTQLSRSRSTALVEPTQPDEHRSTALVRPPGGLPLTSDFGANVGYPEMLSARGAIRLALI